MLKEIPLLRAPENKRTGIEMRPKVKCPDQTEEAIVSSLAHAGLHISVAICHSAKPMNWRKPIHRRVEEPAVSLGDPLTMGHA
jgi:hypothetical protein